MNLMPDIHWIEEGHRLQLGDQEFVLTNETIDPLRAVDLDFLETLEDSVREYLVARDRLWEAYQHTGRAPERVLKAEERALEQLRILVGKRKQ